MATPSVLDRDVMMVLRGTGDELGLQLEDITRPGVDGHAFGELGKRADVSPLLTVLDVASVADAETEYAACKALEGQIGTVKYGSGEEVVNVVVLKVRKVRAPQSLPVAVGSARVNDGNVLLWLEWLVQQKKA